MTLRIPIAATANQTLSVSLAGQFCKISITQRDGRVYLSLNAGGVDVINTRICRDRTKLVRGVTQSFNGDLAFIDTRGDTDPDYAGFGTRYRLVYLP